MEGYGVDRRRRVPMSSALSVDLRQRVVHAVEAGASRHQAAERFGVSLAPGSKAQELGRLTIDRDSIAFALCLNLPLAIAGRHRDLAGSSTARPEIG